MTLVLPPPLVADDSAESWHENSDDGPDENSSPPRSEPIPRPTRLCQVAMNFEGLLQQFSVGSGVLTVCNPQLGGGMTDQLDCLFSKMGRLIEMNLDNKFSNGKFKFYAGVAKAIPWSASINF